MSADFKTTDSPRTKFTSLNVVTIETPCQMDWDLMTDASGDGRVRFCDHCTKNVYNISEMEKTEAMELINSNERHLCIRMFQRPDGTIVTADCPTMKRHVPVNGRRRWFQFSLAGLLALLTTSAALSAAAPWIGPRLQPIVDRWFPPEPPAQPASKFINPTTTPTGGWAMGGAPAPPQALIGKIAQPIVDTANIDAAND